MPSPKFIFLLLASLLVLGACSDGSDSSPGQPLSPLGMEVDISSGPLLGQDSGRAAAWEWLAVPYAAPPTGERRWKAPQAVAGWDSPRAAQAFAPACPQYDFSAASSARRTVST